jgi:parallel beta-helix repeat protein
LRRPHWAELPARRLLPWAVAVVLVLGLAAVGLARNLVARTSPAMPARGAGPSFPAGPAPTAGPAGKAAAPGCDGVSLTPDSDVHAVVEQAGDGATLCFRVGLYRVDRPIAPRDRQTLQAEPGTVISGAKPLTGFRRVGRAWAAGAFLPDNPRRHGECRPQSYTGCQYGEAVFYDDRPLWRVMSVDEIGPGKFYQDYKANDVWIGDDPAGHRVEQSVADWVIFSRASRVTVRGFVLEKAKRIGLESGDNDGWLIEHNEMRLNHGNGLATGLRAHGSVVRANHTHHNGEVGLGGGGTDTLFEDNETDHNNTAGYDQFWSAGGAKWVWSTRLVIRHNYAHDNAGPGLWTDIDNRYTLYERNRVERNAGPGIFHEISYDATIRGNAVSGNAFDPIYRDWYVGAGICVAESSNVEVQGNTVADNANGITVVMQERGAGAHGRYEARNDHVHDNVVVMSGGATGLANNTGDAVYWSGKDNRFNRNTYRVDNLSAGRWLWEGNRLRTKDEWVALGHDRDGRFEIM